jgi:hypothetical protein
VEFQSPKIHTPFYNIEDNCNPYARDDKLFLETLQRHFNLPLESSGPITSRSAASSGKLGLMLATAAGLLFLLTFQ